MIVTPTFSTFCHISDHGQAGYVDLRRMMAVSQSLHLWAPSSALLMEHSGLTGEQFIEYVAGGYIKVTGRSRWIFDKQFRNSRPWAGAKWDNSIDGELRRICIEDEREEDAAKRRVTATEDEKGWDRADEYLSAHPKEVERWSDLFGRPDATEYLPPGTYESAYRVAAKHDDKRYPVARSILRDAFNHGDAFVTSRAEIPFLLKSTDQRFVELLAHGPQLNPETALAVNLQSGTDQRRPTSVEIAAQVVELLSHLEIRAEPENFESFMKGDGHLQLVQWISRLCGILNHATSPSDVDAVVLDTLIAELHHGKFEQPLRGIFRRNSRVATLLTSASALTMAGDMATGGSAWDQVGLAVATVSFSFCLLKETGYVAPRYNGPNWPFLYLDMRLRPRELSEMLRVLQQIRRNR